MSGAIDIGMHMAALTRVRAARTTLESLGAVTQPLRELDPVGLRQAYEEAVAGADLLEQAGTGLSFGSLWKVRMPLDNAINPRVDTFVSRAGVETRRVIPPQPSKESLGTLIAAARGSEHEISATLALARMTDDELAEALRGLADGLRSGNAGRLRSVKDFEGVVERQFGRLLSPFHARVAARRFGDAPKVTAGRIVELQGQAFRDIRPEQARAELQVLLRSVEDDLPTPLQALRINELLHVRGVREGLPQVSEVSREGAEWTRATYGMGAQLDTASRKAVQQEVANLRLAVEAPSPAVVRDRLRQLSGQPQLTGRERREILAGLVGVPEALGAWRLPSRKRDSGILGGDLLVMQHGLFSWDAADARPLHSVLSIRDGDHLRARLIELARTEGAATDPHAFREVATLARQSEVGDWLSQDHWNTIERATWKRIDGVQPSGGQAALDAVAGLAAEGRRAPDHLEAMLGSAPRLDDDQLDQAARLWRATQLEGADEYPALRSAFLEQLDARMAKTDPLRAGHEDLRAAMEARARDLFTPGSATPFGIARGEVARAIDQLGDSLSTENVGHSPQSPLQPARRLGQAMQWLIDGTHGYPVDPAIRRVADDTWEYLRRNIAVMDHTASSVGYSNYPDHAELGRALQNARLVVGLTDAPAPAARAGTAAERLSW